MAKTLLLDEFHLSIYAPRGLPDTDYEAIRTLLDDVRFQAELRRAVRNVIGHYPALSPVRVKLSR